MNTAVKDGELCDQPHPHQSHIDKLYALFDAPTCGAILWRDLTISERHIILGIGNIYPRHAGLKKDDLNSFSTENRCRIRKTIRMLNNITAKFERLLSSEF